MSHRRIVALGATALVSAVLGSGCGGYEKDPAATGGGTTGGATATGGNATGGSGVTGGTGGSATGGTTSTGGSATGGSATGGSGGSGGSGMSGSGGGGGGGQVCENVTACGGGVVGAWNVMSSCLTVSGMVNVSRAGIGCEMAPVTGSLMVTGMWTVTEEGSMVTDATTTTGTENITLPPECLTVSGTMTTCGEVSRSFSALGYAMGTCTDAPAGGGCDCVATVNQTGQMGIVGVAGFMSGTFSTADNVVTVTDGFSEAKYSYCLADSTITMSVASMANTGTVTGTIVLHK
jgi:hypothetical protein